MNDPDGVSSDASAAFDKQDQKEKEVNSAGWVSVFGIVVTAFCAWKILRRQNGRVARK